MKFLSAASLLQFLLIFVLRSNINADGAVGLYGPDRYEGLPESCLQPMDFGYCRAKIQRFYFDIRRMKCNMFYWGGCAGNDNNFTSLDECNDYCATNGAYQETNSVVPTKRERVVNNPVANEYNSNVNTKFTRGGGTGNAKATAPKFTVKNAPSFRDNNSSSNNNNNNTLKASAKSFNVNSSTATKQQIKTPTADNFEDEEYDD